MLRSKHAYEEKLQLKAESLTNLADVVNLYHGSHVLWSDKIVQRVEMTENILLSQLKSMQAEYHAKLERLKMLSEAMLDCVNQKVRVKEQRLG
jgi:hypothetical protein